MLVRLLSSQVKRAVLNNQQSFAKTHTAQPWNYKTCNQLQLVSLQYRPASSARETKAAANINQIIAEAQAALDHGDLQKAYDKFKTAVKMEQSGNNYYNAGVCAHLLGKTDEAIDQWERAIAMDMKLPEAHVNLGTTYFVKKGERERGLRHMQRALRLKPKDMEIRFNLGAMYDSVGELELAKKLLEDCVRCDIENADVLLRNVNAKIAAKALAKEKK